jgi:hypothetical protein
MKAAEEVAAKRAAEAEAVKKVADEVAGTGSAEAVKKVADEVAGTGSSPAPEVGTKSAATPSGSTPPPNRFRDA